MTSSSSAPAGSSLLRRSRPSPAPPRRSVVAQTEHVDRFEQLLLEHGLPSERTDRDRLSITGTDRTVVAQLALDHQIRLDELTDHHASLEDVLVDLTHSSAEFAST